MKYLAATCGMALVLCVPAVAATSAPAAAAASDLKPDPSVRFGVLPNGMHYEIMHNATPPHNASLRLRMDVGSMYEREDQRGLAHFIEHMVLNGTTHVPEGEFVKRLERAGLKFGPDTNATTEFQQTVYMLDLPETDAGTIDTALFMLREATGEATFAPDAIDRERGVVLSEERTRATPQLRNAEDELGYLLKGDVLPTRMPIGSTDVIRTANHDKFVEFYNAYYRPERATLIAVGDFDVDQMEAKIRAQFGGWQGRGKPGAELPAPQVAARSEESRIFSEDGVANRVSLAWVTPPDLREDSRAVREEHVIPALGLAILNRRLSRLAESGDAPFVAAVAVRQEQARRAEVTQIFAIAKPGQWKQATAAIEQEQRRALQFGFTQAELDREVTEARAALTTAVAGADTRQTPHLAQLLVAKVDGHGIFTTPAEGLAEFDQWVHGLTAQQVTEATRKLFAAGGPLVYLTSPTPVQGGEAAVRTAFDDSRKAPVTAGTIQQAMTWPYQSFGPAGAPVERRELAALGATAVRFANGVRLTVKHTDFAKDQILVSARIGNGLLDLPAADARKAWAFSAGAYTLGGLGKLGAEDIQQALTSKVYGMNFGLGENGFTLGGRTRPADLATQLQVLAAYVTDPGYKPTGWNRLRSMSATIHDQLASTPGGVANRDLSGLLHAGDPRFVTPSRDEMASSSIEAAKALVARPLSTEPIEITIVGDVSVDEAIRQVGATFGALPPRKEAPLPATALHTAFPAPGLVRETHNGRADQGLAFIAWPTADFYSDVRRARTLNVLAEVLQLRLIDEIREKQGTTYSPAAGHEPSETFPGYGYMAARIEAPPEKLDGFLTDAARIAADLRDHPVTADELERARKPLIENLLRQQANNAWWLAELSDIQSKPKAAEAIATMLDQYRAVTAADLQEAARRYLVDAKAWKLEVVPAAKAAAATTPAATVSSATAK
ncbi:MAG TPA: insulinase family protein [Allosphingosinicella sp.]|jgi:zinc protease|nr:insulinase family protein [Allosphingosinicella sp.]